MSIENMRVISITVNVICIIICSLLGFLYTSKRKVTTKENSIYDVLLVCNIISLILELTFYLTSFTNENDIFVSIIEKSYFAANSIWMFLYTVYIFIITQTVFRDRFDKWKYLKKKNLILNIMFVIALLVLLLPVENIYEKGLLVSSAGASPTFMFLVCFSLIVIDVIMVIIARKKIEKNKTIPLIVFLILIFGEFILSLFGFKLLLITLPMTLVSFLMYHTIENPDMKLITALNEARDQADKANNAKSEFLSSMSHEIRTPLNAIVGFSQALKEENIPEESMQEVDDIIMASQNLLEIVNGILDISKIEANKIEIINVDYNFKKVFDELTSLTKARLGEKPIDFRISYDESIPHTLNGDYSRIKQVVLNLLTNAVKYTDEGYIEFRVSSIKKDNVCRLIISVEDSGIGIKQENISKLFSKFERFDEERNITIEGTGLGLAITKKLVDLMNGKIVVQSIYGEGSKFTVAIDQLISKDQVEVLEFEEESTILNLSSKKILIVDDNRVNLKVASRLLKNYQIETEEVISGDECITKIRSGRVYDLIFMDDMMPKMSGTETLKHLKQLDEFDIPTIALTANAISGMREKYLAEGFDDYLAKPIDKKELEKVLQKFLSN